MFSNENVKNLRVIIKTKHEVLNKQTPSHQAVSNINNYISSIKGNVNYISKLSPHIIATIPFSELKSLRKYPDVLELEVDVPLKLHYIKKTALTTTAIPLSEAVNSTKVNTLWNNGMTGKNIRIAIVDTGINKNHPMFVDVNGATKVIKEVAFGCVYNSYDDWTILKCASVLDPNDDFVGHGTATASCAAGYQWDTPHGMLNGSSPDAKLINVNTVDKVYDPESGNYFGILSTINLLKGIDWLFTPESSGGGGGADIVSMSFGSGIPLKVMRNIIDIILSNNSIPVASIGNSGPSLMTADYPGGFQECISCGSYALKTPNFNNSSTFSSRGPGYNACIKPDFLAPGGNSLMAFELEGNIGDNEHIITASPTGYIKMRGTSFSCPIIAGVLACLRERYNFNQLYSLKQKNNNEGYGLIDSTELYNNLLLVSKNNQNQKTIRINNYEPYLLKGTSDTWTDVGVMIPTPYRINNKLMIYYTSANTFDTVIGTGVFEYDETNKTIIDYGVVIDDSRLIPGIVNFNNIYYAFYTYEDTITHDFKLIRMESIDGIQWTNHVVVLETLPEIPNYPYANRMSIRVGAVNFGGSIFLYLDSGPGALIQYLVYDVSTNTVTENGISIQMPRASDIYISPCSYKVDWIYAPYCYIENDKVVMILCTQNNIDVKPMYLLKAESIDGKAFTTTQLIEPSKYTDFNFLWGLYFGTLFENKLYYSDGGYSNWLYRDMPPKIYMEDSQLVVASRQC